MARSALQDHDRSIRSAPDGMAQRRARVLHLPLVRCAAELPRELDDLAERGSAERLSLGEQATARIHRQASRALAFAALHERAAFAARAETELLDREDLAPAIGVLELDDVEIARPEPGGVERLARRELGRARRVGGDQPGEGRVLAERTPG